MDIPQLISKNHLETLELDDFSTGYNCDHFSQSVDFLFPIPNKEKGVHHFSSLRCLKIWDLHMGPPMSHVEEEVRNRLSLFDDKNLNRINLAYPNLRALALGEFIYASDLATRFANKLLAARGPHLESLHVSSSPQQMADYIFFDTSANPSA